VARVSHRGGEEIEVSSFWGLCPLLYAMKFTPTCKERRQWEVLEASNRKNKRKRKSDTGGLRSGKGGRDLTVFNRGRTRPISRKNRTRGRSSAMRRGKKAKRTPRIRKRSGTPIPIEKPQMFLFQQEKRCKRCQKKKQMSVME